MRPSLVRPRLHLWILAAAFFAAAIAYWPGLNGSFLFDDYPNIVDNHGVQPQDASVPSLVRAALSSPSSEFKRPLASLSFATNYLITGLDPYWMKLTNLIIHLLNGLLIFLLARALIGVEICKRLSPVVESASTATISKGDNHASLETTSFASEADPASTDAGQSRSSLVAALIAASWMLLPINLTGVLYVVQRMESLANLFVLLGLIGYVVGRRRMLAIGGGGCGSGKERKARGSFAVILCIGSITLPTAFGLLAKETAVMLPLYALSIEWILFGFQRITNPISSVTSASAKPLFQRRDLRIMLLFLLVLALPMAIGLTWLLPGMFDPQVWATRDFTLTTRLLSEARIVVDYIVWTLLPSPRALSFYHDNFHISSGLLTPWTTVASMVVLALLVASMFWLRKRRPLVALGIALFLSCHLLTGTILPLELIYEHRNYFASFGLLLAIVPLLAAPPLRPVGAPLAKSAMSQVAGPERQIFARSKSIVAVNEHTMTALPMALPRYALLAGLMLCWTGLTAITAYAWSSPLRLAEDLASRAPMSPRAQYELGRTYIIYSNYDPSSPFTPLAYAPLERSAALPNSSILAEQALIFMNARMHLPLKDAWWGSMISKLEAHKPGVQDESSLGALTQCAREHHCDLPANRMVALFEAALSHSDPSARLLATYGDYAWNILGDHALGQRMTEAAIKASPSEPAYQITLIRMLVVQGFEAEAQRRLDKLTRLNLGGRLDQDLLTLRDLPGLH